MHLFFLSHSHPGHLERFMNEIGKRGYTDVSTPQKVRYTAIFREVRMWDVLIPEGCKDDFLADMSCFYPGEEYLERHTKHLSRFVKLIRRISRFFGAKPIELPEPKQKRYPNRYIDGVQTWVWLIPRFNLDELRDKEGREQW